MATRRAREMAKLLARREREGLTYAELSEVTGLAPATLSWWSWRLRRASTNDVELAEVAIVESGRPADAESRSVTIRCGPFLVDVANDFDSETLRRVLDVVADARC